MVLAANVTSIERLASLWRERFQIDFAVGSPTLSGSILSQVISLATAEAKAATAEKVLRKLDIHTEFSGVLTNQLLSYLDNSVDLGEARRLARSLKGVYEKLLGLYQRETLPSDFLQRLPGDRIGQREMTIAALVIPDLDVLEESLEGDLYRFRQAHYAAPDPRMIGFLTTLLHFANQNLLGALTAGEKILLSPYLRFVEEQVCIPWRRVCKAAAGHDRNSPTLMLVEKLLPLGNEIAGDVYQELVQQFGAAQSRRGRLTHDGIRHSVLRDLVMVQTHLHLCLLENDAKVVSDSLVPLCVIVFPSIGVGWDVVEGSLPILFEAINSRLEAAEQERLSPVFSTFQTLFSAENPMVHQLIWGR